MKISVDVHPYVPVSVSRRRTNNVQEGWGRKES